MTTINGKEYRIPTLDIFQEFALASTLSPILAVMSLQQDRSVLEKKFSRSFTALSANMPREDKDDILRAAVTGVMRQEGASWAPLSVNGRIMYQDVNLEVVLKLLWEVIIAHKMIDFFAVDPSELTGQEPKPGVPTGSDTSTVG